MSRHVFSRTVVVLGACALVIAPGRAVAQDFPGKPFISAAADQLNSLAPQATPAQTIELGIYDGATNTFTFLVPDYYPPGLPAFKRAENGGPVQPQHLAIINAYNVTYKFTLHNPPAGLTVKLANPDGAGDTTIIDGTVTGSVATVKFNPRATQRQRVTFRANAQHTTATITPILQAQFGAFVVPHMLISVIYEPPGSGSTASYQSASSAGTTLSWGFAQSTGLVDTYEPDKWINLLKGAASSGASGAANTGVAGAIGGGGVGASLAGGLAGAAAAAAVTIYIELGSHNVQTITTTTHTTEESHAQGTSFTITQGFQTALHTYPGQGDLFVILHDVLFAYVVDHGRVRLAPLAYSGVDAQTATELQAHLPAALAAQYIGLDPLLSGGLPGVAVRPPIPIALHAAARFTSFATLQCDSSATALLELTQADFQSSTVTHTMSQTTLTKATGMLAAMGGGGDHMWGIQYSSSAQQTTGSAVIASIATHCAASEPQIAVDVYYDNVFRTFVPVAGAPLGAHALLTGTVLDALRHPLANRSVTLEAGGKRWIASSNASGRFAFRFANLPTGAAKLRAGRTTRSVTLGPTTTDVTLDYIPR